MNLTQEQFFTGDIQQATGWDKAGLQNVLSRGRIDLPYPNPGAGGRRLFTAEAVLHLAFAREQMTRFLLGPNQATALVRRMTKDVRGELRPYLGQPTGAEVFVFRTTLGAEDQFNSATYDFYADGMIDAADWDPCALILCVGKIAKDVLAKLEEILAERRGQTNQEPKS